MSIYRMGDGTVINTEKAKQHWTEAMDWDGSNYYSRATGSQWNHQDLYLSRRNRFYIERSSQMQGSRDSAEWISEQEGVRWLLANDHRDTVPAEFEHLIDEVEE